MSDHDDRLAELAVEQAEQPQDLVGALAVEVAGRLVGDDQVGVGDDRPGDRDALLLTAGELAGVMVLPPFEAHDPEGGHRAAASDLFRERWVRSRRKLDVLERRHHGDQVVHLEDEADVMRLATG